MRLEVLARDNYQCKVRGPHCKGHATEADHIIPWRDGGPWFDPANLRAACDWCNTWRAQRQKAEFGWKRAKTHITLVCGPPGACAELLAYIEAHSSPADLVIDYRSLAAAIGDRPDEVRKLRGSLITKVRRGESDAPRVWITSTNPDAEKLFPHHDAVVIDPGIERALACIFRGGEHLVYEWYRKRQVPELVREW